MATYVVGDIHGCFETLERLLGVLPFDGARDRLWLTGDLVNRGPNSLAVLRWALETERALGDRFVSVLGNHDLHLLATAAGCGRARHHASFAPILAALDREALLEWLACRPLLHREGRTVLIHAGLLPQWTVGEAASRAKALETALRERERRQQLLEAMAASPRAPKDLYALTALRLFDAAGAPHEFNGTPEDAPEGCVAWFDVPHRKSREALVLAGHWAALGLRMDDRFVALDTGCVYGGALTAIRLEDREVFSVANAESAPGRPAQPKIQ